MAAAAIIALDDRLAKIHNQRQEGTRRNLCPFPERDQDRELANGSGLARVREFA